MHSILRVVAGHRAAAIPDVELGPIGNVGGGLGVVIRGVLGRPWPNAWLLVIDPEVGATSVVDDVEVLVGCAHGLRGPAAILFISRDASSDSIAKLFRDCSYGVSHNHRARHVANGVLYRCSCVPNEVQRRGGGGMAPFLGSAKKYRALYGASQLGERQGILITKGVRGVELEGRGCLGEGRLGVPGQVWEFRFLPSFP